MALLERILVEPAEPLGAVSDLPPGTRYVPERPLTVDEFYELIDEDSPAELDEGAIIMPSPAGYRHEDCFGLLQALLRTYVGARDLGVVLGAHSKVRLGPRTAREPDLLFVAKERRHLVTELEVTGPPDLVVEIINSPKGRSEALAKVPQYRDAGVHEVWLIDLVDQRVSQLLLGDGEYVESVLTGERELQSAAIPGFHIAVSTLLAEAVDPWPILRELLGEQESA